MGWLRRSEPEPLAPLLPPDSPAAQASEPLINPDFFVETNESVDNPVLAARAGKQVALTLPVDEQPDPVYGHGPVLPPGEPLKE